MLLKKCFALLVPMFLVFGFGLVSCGDDDVSEDIDLSDFVGTYTGSCCEAVEDAPGVAVALVKLKITNTEVENTFNFYSYTGEDPTCNDSDLVKTMVQTYKITKTIGSEKKQAAYFIEAFSKATLTLRTEAEVNAANAASLEGANDWVLNEPKDITTSVRNEMTENGNDPTGINLYEYYQLVGGVLYTAIYDPETKEITPDPKSEPEEFKKNALIKE